MKSAGRMRLIGRSTVLGISLCAAEIMAIVILAIMHLLSYAASPVIYGIFGALTTVLVSSWLTADAAHAYASADKQGFLARDTGSNRVVAVREKCPRVWLVKLHILLHPELMGVT